MTTAESIEKLLQEKRYDPSIAGTLQSFLTQQIQTGVYSLDANVTLLKFYQHQPSLLTVESLNHILIKSIMALPSTDFLTCLFLIPEKTQQDPAVAAIVSLGRRLESAEFEEFWREADALKAKLSGVNGFENAVREYIFDAISISHKSIPAKQLAQTLRSDAAGVSKLAAARGLKPAAEDVIVFPQTLQIARPKAPRQQLDIHQVAPVLRKICK